jgi:hypothetical protein
VVKEILDFDNLELIVTVDTLINLFKLLWSTHSDVSSYQIIYPEWSFKGITVLNFLDILSNSIQVAFNFAVNKYMVPIAKRLYVTHECPIYLQSILIQEIGLV